MGSLDVFAEQVGPIMSKDMKLFAQGTDDTPDRAVLLQAAERFLELLGCGRSVGKGGRR